MKNHDTNGGTLVTVLEGLAALRGLTLADVADGARRRGHAYTPAEIAGGRCGFGDAGEEGRAATTPFWQR